MCDAAIAKGFDLLGFSSHSEMLADVGEYLSRIRNCAKLYEGRLIVKAGIEMELALPWVEGDYDFVIGSVHCVRAPDGVLVSVDHTPERTVDGVAAHFGGDYLAFAKGYFAAVRDTLHLPFDIVGHCDLIRKFSGVIKELGAALSDKSMAEEVEETAEAIAKSGKTVEINTGGITRGWLTEPYPAPAFQALLEKRGVKFINSSDAHSVDQL